MFCLFSRMIGQHCRAGRPIALAKDELGRVPAVVLGDEPRNEARKRIGVLIDAPESLLRTLAVQPPKPRTRHVNKNQVAHVQQGIGVVHHLVGRRRHVRVGVGDHVLGAQRTHVQPYRRAARPAVVEERDRPLFGLCVLLEVGHVEHPRRGFGVLSILRCIQRQLAARLRLSVHSQLRILKVGCAYRYAYRQSRCRQCAARPRSTRPASSRPAAKVRRRPCPSTCLRILSATSVLSAVESSAARTRAGNASKATANAAATKR